MLAVIGTGCAFLTAGDREGLIALGGYGLAFLVFVVGFGAWTRARAQSSGMPRGLLLTALFFATIGPWIAMAIFGLFANGDDAKVAAAPSPTYAFVMLEALTNPFRTDSGPIVMAGSICAAAWALLGLGLLVLANGRVVRRLREEEKLREELEKYLDSEVVPTPVETAPAPAG
jgi:hypothetical protein